MSGEDVAFCANSCGVLAAGEQTTDLTSDGTEIVELLCVSCLYGEDW